MNLGFAARFAIAVVLLAFVGQPVAGFEQPLGLLKLGRDLPTAVKPNTSKESGTAGSTAIITAIVEINVERMEDLNFGTIVSIQPKGDVTINPETGEKLISGGVLDFGGFHSPAEFLVTGQADATIVITLPTEVSLARRGGGNPVIVRRFTSFPLDTATARLGPGGEITIFVGGKIDVQPEEREGDYVASFMIFVDYAE